MSRGDEKKRETVEKLGEDEEEGNEVGGSDRKEEWREVNRGALEWMTRNGGRRLMKGLPSKIQTSPSS